MKADILIVSMAAVLKWCGNISGLVRVIRGCGVVVPRLRLTSLNALLDFACEFILGNDIC